MSTSAYSRGRVRRRSALWSLGICSIGVTVLAAGALSQRVREKPDQELTNLARMAARYELMVLHWKSLETQKDFLPLIDRMFDEIVLDPEDAGWRLKVFGRPSDPKVRVNKFEAKALDQIEAGRDEVSQRSDGGSFIYVRAFRATESCIACHSQIKGKPTAPNEIIAVVGLESVARRAKPRERVENDSKDEG